MHDAIRALGWRVSIGVTTGTAFCGEIGSDARREYTVMGDTVNLAARLMQASGGGILCDEATASRASPATRLLPWHCSAWVSTA